MENKGISHEEPTVSRKVEIPQQEQLKLSLPSKPKNPIPEATVYSSKVQKQKPTEESSEEHFPTEKKNLPQNRSKLTLPEKPKYQMPKSTGTPSPKKAVSVSAQQSATDIISLLEKHNIKYVDKRANNGSLWIVGGHELDDVVREAKAMGVQFKFKEEGGKATKGAPGWWTK